MPGAEQLADSLLLERVHVLARDDAAAGDEDVVAALLVEQLADPRKQRHVGAAKYRQADDIDVFLHGGGGDHLGRLMETRVDDFHPRVAERGRDDFRAAIVAVEAGLGY